MSFGLFSFLERKIIPGFKIPKNKLVIDIGSGDKPFWRADVFYDNLAFGDIQRVTQSKTIEDVGYFVNGDISKMPFKDRAFDLSFCNHLLEHVERPDIAINEIVRISKGGYIESPNGIIEMIRPHPAHLWFMFFNNGKLVFIRKSKVMHQTLTDNSSLYQYLLYAVKESFIRLNWRKKIEYEIIDNLKESEKYYPNEENHHDQHAGTSKISYYLLLVKILRKLFFRPKEVKVLKFLERLSRK